MSSTSRAGLVVMCALNTDTSASHSVCIKSAPRPALAPIQCVGPMPRSEGTLPWHVAESITVAGSLTRQSALWQAVRGLGKGFRRAVENQEAGARLCSPTRQLQHR